MLFKTKHPVEHAQQCAARNEKNALPGGTNDTAREKNADADTEMRLDKNENQRRNYNKRKMAACGEAVRTYKKKQVSDIPAMAAQEHIRSDIQ
jgi:hypothetical protein